MTAFRLLLLTMFIILSIYTGLTIMEYGLNLFPYFFGDMASINWPGQFNLDFMFMLMVSALWVAWSNKFTPLGLLLGVFALFGGIGFLSVYLLYKSGSCEGDFNKLVLGERA